MQITTVILILMAAFAGAAMGFELAQSLNRRRHRALRAYLQRVIDQVKRIEHEFDHPLATDAATRAAFERECG